MHILFFTDNFPPEVNAPAVRTYEHAKQWVKMGHKVTIITCAPNFPKGIIFPGYRNKFIQFEVVDGVHLIRVWSFLAPNKGFFLRSLDHASYAMMAIVGSFFAKSVDVVIGTSPQFFTTLAAFAVSRIRKKRFVFELRDLWPASLKAVSLTNNDGLIKFIEKIELYLYRRADLIISVTNSFKKNLIVRGIDEKKIKVVTNGVSQEMFFPRKKNKQLLKSLGLKNDFVCGYIGTHGMAHGLETILETAHICKRLGISDIKFLFLGDGAKKEELIEEANRMQLDNIIFHPTVGKDLIVEYWSVLDVSLVHLRGNDLFKEVIPSKIFEAMAMAKPIILGVAGEAAGLVEQANAGLIVPPENPELMLQAIIKLKTDRSVYERLRFGGLQSSSEFERGKLAQKMLSYL